MVINSAVMLQSFFPRLLASKGTSSWSGWRAVLMSDRFDSQGAAVHAVERWLCFHAGSWQGR